MNTQFTKVGLLGGTFNPVHNGHIKIASEVLSSLSLDRVIFIPSGNPPHKCNAAIIPFQHRYQMVEIAVNDYPRFIVSDLDNTAGEKSYTKRLIERFKELYPHTKPVFIIGEDNIAQLKTWYEYKWILENITIVAVRRTVKNEYTGIDYIDKITLLDIEPIEISSQGIRIMLNRGEDIASLVPPGVNDYIKRYNLYSK